MSPASSPIVVLDSGIGGLTVARAIRRLMPHEDILYFGDTARVPYGSKSPATVTHFVRQIISFLEPYRPKHIVFACNTATALSLVKLRSEFPHLSMSGVIEPGSRAAVEAAGQKLRPLMAVIGTEATIRSKAYENAILRRRQYARVIGRSTALLVPAIEEGRSGSDPVVKLMLEQYLQPFIERKMDVLVLGCTHYPLYKDVIQRIVTDRVAVIDSADKCAEDVRRRLRIAGLECTGRVAAGSLRCFVTDDGPRFATLASRFLGLSIEKPIWVSPDDLQAAAEDEPEPLREAV